MKTSILFQLFAKKFIFIFVFVVYTEYSFTQTLVQKSFIQNETNITELNQMATDFATISIQEKNVAVAWANANGYPVSGTLPDSGGFELMRLSDTGMPEYYITNNINSAKTISTNKVWSGGGADLNLSGSGITIGLWDQANVCDNHSEFGGRSTAGTEALNSTVNNYGSYHSTHVAGTLIAYGIDANAKGMAPTANIIHFDWNSDVSEMATAAAPPTLLLFSNHSYGPGYGWEVGNFGVGNGWYWFGIVNFSITKDFHFGFYDNSSKKFDQIAQNAPYYLIVKSAGNERGEGPPNGTAHFYLNPNNNYTWESSTTPRELDGGVNGYDCLDPLSVPKNILTVGAINDIPNGYSSSTDVVMTSFSSWGPTDDGRIKPDIVANGSSLYSSNGNSDCSTLGYISLSGTSMSAPSVTGSLALLQEHYSNTHSNNLMKASTLKALVIQTADEAGTSSGPDYKFGWGLMNTEKAAQAITKDANMPETIQEAILNDGKTNTIAFYYDGTESFIKATIAWTDPAGTPVTAQLNPTTPMLVNDLDLRIVRLSDGQYFSPWKLNPANPANSAVKQDNAVDNVEQVFINNNLQIGDYIVLISHKGILQGGSQAYSIITNVGTGVVGFEDRVEFGGISCSNYENTNPLLLTLGANVKYCATFIDEEPYGDNAVSWDWKIGLYSSQDIYTLAQASTSGSSFWDTNIPTTLPDNDWLRDDNNNIIGRVFINAKDNLNYYHTKSMEISLFYPPNKPVVSISNATCTGATFTFYARGATDYKICYASKSGGPYTAGANLGNINTKTLTWTTHSYYFVVKAINSAGESIYSNEVNNIPFDAYEYTVQTSDTWQSGAGNNPFNSVDGLVQIKSNLIIPAGKTITIKNMNFNFAPNANVVVQNTGKLILDNTVFTAKDLCTNSYSPKWQGINAQNGSTVELINGSIIENAINGINSNVATINISNSELNNNSSAISLSEGVLNITSTTFNNNTTQAIYANSGEVNITNSVFTNNVTSILSDDAINTLLNCTFQNNNLAINAKNQSALNLTTCNFIENLTAIIIKDYTTSKIFNSEFNFNENFSIKYENNNAYSIILNSNFYADAACFEGTFIYANESSNIKISGTHFENRLNFDEDYCEDLNGRGKGIIAVNSAINITGCPIIGCQNENPNIFEELTEAISISNNNGFQKVIIRNNNFINNKHAIYLSECNNPTVILNDIVVGTPYDVSLTEPSISTYNASHFATGLYLSNSTGYKIEDNTFTNSTYYNAQIGLLVLSNNQNNNQIYRNTFTNLPYATIFQNFANKSAKQQQLLTLDGLQVRCNTFANNKYDFATTTSGSVNDYQGCDTIPSGNILSLNTTNLIKNIYAGSDYWIFYKYNPSGTNEFPNKISTTISTQPLSYFTKTWNEYCPSHLSISKPPIAQISQKFYETSTNSNQLTTQFNGSVDANNTDWLLKKISQNHNPSNMKKKLLEASPWLSDTVMVSLIGNDNYFAATDLTEVLVSNPQSATSSAVQTSLDSMATPLPYTLRMQINSQDTVLSPKATMEAQLASLLNEKEYYANEIINYYLSDTLPGAKDSLIAFLASQNTLNFDYKLFSYYYTLGQTADARNLLTQIPTKYSQFGEAYASSFNIDYYNKFNTLYNILLELKENNLSTDSLNIAQIQTLRTLAIDTVSLPGNIAKRIICKIDSVPYNEWLRLPYETTTTANSLMGYVYESAECGSNPYPNCTLVIINENSDTLLVTPAITDSYGFFQFNEAEIATLNPDEVVTIATKSGWSLSGAEMPQFKPLSEWLGEASASSLTLTLANSNLEWADLYSTVDSLYNGGTVLDLNGNLYVAGYTNTPFNFNDFLIIKYSPTGERLWVNTYNGSANFVDRAVDLAVDNENNCYVLGNSHGAGTYSDIVLLKYSSNGNKLWEKRINGTANLEDDAKSVVTDASNNVYITGSVSNTSTGSDIVTIKYSKTGQLKWQKIYSTSNNEYSTSLKIDKLGNIIVAGYGSDYIIIKYNTNGSLLWLKQYDSGLNDIVYDLTTDNNNNIIVVGAGVDLTTVKYNSSGVQQWVSHTTGRAFDIVTDSKGNIYITGNVSYDGFTLKYDTNGVQQWKKLYTTSYYNGVESFQAIAIDNNNDVYVTGYSATETFAKYFDMITIKYDSESNEKWRDIQSGGYRTQNRGNDIVVSDNNNVYVTGVINENSLYKMATVKYSQCPSTANLKSSILKPDVTSNNQTLEDIEDDELIQVINFKENKVIVYPNPYSESTRIELITKTDAQVSLEVFTMDGRLIENIFTGFSKEGKYNYTFSAKKRGYSAGTYILKMTIGNEINSYWLVEMK